ncbi:(2,3-dihydroxybenzoyl)adenylate synthase [Spirillospora sp. NPDC048911]|uniref:(2,3-dihydroxybenzoyl)adenylate synthase n=1 Tax=Spirillospora sp. NPDC048911 TaxID=3364527 RepID=UPI00370FEEBA
MLEGCTSWPAALAERYRRDGLWTGESLSELPAAWARAFGDKTAMVSGSRRLSFTELAERIDRTAAGFQRQGIRPDDRVVLQLPNVPEFIIVAFALFRMGAKPVFSLASHRANEIGHLCSLSEATGYVIPAEHRGFDHTALGAQMLDEVPTLRHVFVQGPDSDSDSGELPDPRMLPLAEVDADPGGFPPCDPSDVAFFLLSGGTTALPKLIPRTHDDYSYQTRVVAELCEVSGDDVYLAALPVEFNFTWGCPGVIGTLRSGGTVVLAESPDPETCFGLIERERATVTSAVPTVAQLWLEAAEWVEADLSSLRLLQIGGARLQPEVAARIEPELGCRLQQVFGMAEGLLSMSRPDDAPESVLRTQGRPVSPADEVRIVDEHGRDVPSGTAGELYARGPYTLQGYYKAEVHNRRAFTADGFYRTGDVASVTPEGDLVIEGRLKDVVIRGGDKISAGEVEGHLLAHPSVTRAAVVPVPDEMLGERIYAFLVCPLSTPALPELRQALHERGLAEYKLPDRVEIVADFPLTPLGKIDKKVLAAAAADRDHPRIWTSGGTEGNAA